MRLFHMLAYIFITRGRYARVRSLFKFCSSSVLSLSWICKCTCQIFHYIDVIMTTMASQITSLSIVYSTVYSDADQRKHQSSASLAFVWGIHRDRWIPRTKGQLRGKCFHLMTSSCGITFIFYRCHRSKVFSMTWVIKHCMKRKCNFYLLFRSTVIFCGK